MPVSPAGTKQADTSNKDCVETIHNRHTPIRVTTPPPLPLTDTENVEVKTLVDTLVYQLVGKTVKPNMACESQIAILGTLRCVKVIVRQAQHNSVGGRTATGL